MKIRQVEPKLFHAEDKQKYMTKLIFTFRNFANAPKNGNPFIPPPLSLSFRPTVGSQTVRSRHKHFSV